jgi:hypothetical protein
MYTVKGTGKMTTRIPNPAMPFPWEVLRSSSKGSDTSPYYVGCANCTNLVCVCKDSSQEIAGFYRTVGDRRIANPVTTAP